MRGAEPELQTHWEWQAAGNFMFGGAGAGLLVFTALAAWQDSHWLYRGGLPALALIGLGIICVWLELGRKARFLNVFLCVRTSWMSREAVVASALFPVAFAAIVLLSPGLALVAGLLGLALLYCQGRMLMAAKGIPAWREPAIVPLILATGLAEGASVLVIAGALSAMDAAWATLDLLVLVIVRLVVWGAYRSRLVAPGASPKATVRVLGEMDERARILGHIVPVGLLLVALFIVPARARPIAGSAALLCLWAGWYLKFSLITRAAYNQGFAIPRTPARTPGYSQPGAKPGWT